MPFGELGAKQRAAIILQLENAASFIARVNEAGAAIGRMALSEKALKRETQAANAQTFAQRQGLYTLRRYAFYATNAFTFAGIAVGALGLKFYNTYQTGRIAFQGFIKNGRAVDREMKNIYRTAALTPFTFPALVTATRRLLPFTKNVGLTNKLVLSLANSLSAAGLITDAALTRGSLQLAHMFAVGRLTGQILYNLGRDNVPMMQALEKQFHLTGIAIRKEVAGGLITAQMAADALNKYIAQTPGYAKAAVNQATKTLSGSFSTLKDLLGMSVGGAEGGIFAGIQGVIRGVDMALIARVQKNQRVTLTQLMVAFDKVLSPKTHAVINIFELMYGTLQAVVYEFGALAKGTQLFLQYSGLDRLLNLFGGNRVAARLLGYALGTLITLWIIGATKAFLFTEAVALQKLTMIEWGKSMLFAQTVMKGLKLLMAGEALTALKAWAFATKTVAINNGLATTTELANTSILARLTRFIWGAVAASGAWIAELSVLEIMTGVGIVLILASLVLLYYKWKKFHDGVNNTFKFLTTSSSAIAISLRIAFAPILDAAMALKFIIDNYKKIESASHRALTGGLNRATPEQQRHSPHHSIWWHIIHATPGSAGSNIPGMATGGNIMRPGIVRVGEHGPEVLSLPAGATVTPLSNDHLAGTLQIHVYPQAIYMDGRKVGEAVSTAYLDTDARK